MRRIRPILLAALVLLLVPGTAFASWIVVGTGTGAGRADTVPVGTAPSVAVTGRNVTVSWPAASFADGTPVTGYRVARYDAVSQIAATVATACDGVVTALSCVEAAVPPGTWRYRVTPVQASWTGTEGPQSPIATVASPSFGFASSVTITSLPDTRAGTVSGFVTGESVRFRLDGAGGPLLVGSTTPDPVPFSGAATTSVTLPAGTSDGVHSVFAVGSAGSTASASVTIDTTAPTVSAAVIGKSQGGQPGYLKQGGTYYVYANVSDALSGVASVTANVDAVTAGSTAVALTTGSWTVAGITYGYRSALLTASNPLPVGSTAFSLAATDGVGNAGTTPATVTVDNTAPSPNDVQTANGGATPGKAEAGDTVTLTYGEAMEPESVLAGWNGSATNVIVRLNTAGGQDRLQIWDAANAAQLPLGQLRLGRTDYVTVSVVFTGSTMTLSGGVVTIVLGTPSGATGTAAGTGTITWTPSAVATDLAANACTAVNRAESGAVDVDF